jgi:hypothetical protein
MDYNKSILFFINNYYICINNPDTNYKYDFILIENIFYIIIKNKNKDIYEDFTINIIYNNKKYTINKNIKDNISNIININDISYLPYNELQSNELIYLLDKEQLETLQLFKDFDNNYYIENNNIINKDYLAHNYIKYHWIFCGKYEPYLYFKYLLRKYEDIIFKIPYPKIEYCKNKKKTLLFIDNRYDSSFIYLLILFLYSVDLSWNITVFTTEYNKDYYLSDFKKLNISGNILTLNKDILNINDYSNLLKDPLFWKTIKEDNCLLFQYDSFAMNKFDNNFLNFNYIGAPWDHNASLFDEIKFGNGGTSFRKTRIMEYLCKKYENKDIKKNYPEDIFFSELLYEEKLNICDQYIAHRFSFENIYNENSIYGHQIYKSVDYNDLDIFISNKLTKMAL